MNLAAFRQKPWFSFLLIATACLALYGKSLFFGFVWDDYAEVVMQDQFRQWRNFGDFFTTPYWFMATGGLAPYHRPMVPVMILIVSTFFDTNPFGYHLLNLILFTATSWIYFLFLKQLRLSSWIIFMAAAFFIGHPVHVEAVCWGSARPVLLSGLCFILILYISNRSSSQKPLQIIGRLFLLALIFAIGLNTYHSILTVIPVLLASDLLVIASPLPKAGAKQSQSLEIVRHKTSADPPKNWWRTSSQKPLLSMTKVVQYSVLIFLSALFFFYALTVIRSFDPTADLRPFYNPATTNVVYANSQFPTRVGNWPVEWLLTPLNTLSRYAEILLFPLSLSPDYYFRATELSLSALGAFIFIIMATALATRNPERRNLVLFSFLWIFLGLLTVANLVPQGGLFADRYAYIASMGFCLWLALILEASNRFVGAGLKPAPTVLILLFFIVKTFLQADIWQNDFRFWLEATIASPQKARAHDKLGMILEAQGHKEEAAKEYKKVLELDPENFPAVRNRRFKGWNQ